nr:transmembrane protein 185-like [Ipomoea batatas]GMD27260.1 transmembrane protein 185-like [Ipomoea batatas]
MFWLPSSSSSLPSRPTAEALAIVQDDGELPSPLVRWRWLGAWNSESLVAMREQSNGLRNLASSDKGDKRGGGSGAYNNNHTRASHTNDDNHHHHGGVGGSVSSETSHESKKGGSSSGSDAIPAVWPPKFVIALTNKEKEEDFMTIKGSKLPQRSEPNSSCIFFLLFTF